MKPTEPQSLSSAKNTWIFIGASIIGCLIVLLLIAFLTLGCTKRKRVGSPINVGLENKQHIFERGVGTENKGFVQVGTARGWVKSIYYVLLQSLDNYFTTLLILRLSKISKIKYKNLMTSHII